MNDETFRAFLDLLMCTDPWPTSISQSQGAALTEFADTQSRDRGYDGWIVAYHEFKPEVTADEVDRT